MIGSGRQRGQLVEFLGSWLALHGLYDVWNEQTTLALQSMTKDM